MKIVGARRPGSKNISRVREISRLAKQRLKWMDHYAAHGNAALTCRYFGISRQTFYRWKGRYISRDLRSLEERSHRPRRLRKPTWSRELALAVLHLREQYPRWGKDKLVVMIRDRGWQVSTSMVGRNGCVERAQRTHTEEFYEVNDFSLEMAPLNRELLAWERIYNTVHTPTRPSATSPHPTSIRHSLAIPQKGGHVSPIYWTSTGS